MPVPELERQAPVPIDPDSSAGLGVRLRGESQYAKLFTALLCVPQIVLSLLIDPAFCGGIKRDRKAHGHLRADTGPAIQDSGQRFPAYAESLCRLGHSETKRIETKSLDDFPGMWRIVHSHDLALVVVLVINLICVFSCKKERYTPVAADRYGPNAFAIPLQGMKSQSGEPHILWGCRRAQPAQNQFESFSMLRLDARFRASLEELGQSLVFEAADHEPDCNVCGYGLQDKTRNVPAQARAELCG